MSESVAVLCDNPTKSEKCTKTASTVRVEYEFGDQAKGEEAVTDYPVYLCQHCAEVWDKEDFATMQSGRVTFAGVK